MGRLVSALVLTVTLALVAAGCGSSQSSQEKWANSVCTDLTNWKSQVQSSVTSIQNSLKSPGAGTLDAIRGEINKAVTATQQLGTNLKSHGSPGGSSGDSAKQQIDTLSTQLDKTATQAKQAVQGVPANATVAQTVQALTSLGPQLQSLATSTQTTLNSIQSSATDLKDGFQKADACKPFRS